MDGSKDDVRADFNHAACRRLLAAALVEAVKSAQRGDDQAAGFLDEFGERLGELLGFEMPDWRMAKRVEDVWAVMPQDSEELRERERQRFRDLRERRKDDPEYQERERARWARTNEKRRAERAARKAENNAGLSDC